MGHITSIIDIEDSDIIKILDKEYDPEKYSDKRMIILGVHSHDHNPMKNEEDKQYYFLSKYIKENPCKVVVCATSVPEYFLEGGYRGFDYVKNNFGDIYYIGELVWYPETGWQDGNGQRVQPEKAGESLHRVLDEKFPSKQIILLRPGTPFVGDAIVKCLLSEKNSKDDYLVIDDKQSEIYALAEQARRSLKIIDNPPAYFTSGIDIDKETCPPLKEGALNIITSTNDMYNRNKELPRSLFLRILDKLLSFYLSGAKIVLKSPADPEEILTLEELRQRVSEDQDRHKNIHYTMIINLGRKRMEMESQKIEQVQDFAKIV